MKIFKISALVGATMLVAPTAMAASILIDTFANGEFQRVSDLPNGNPNSSTLTGLSVLGGSRSLEVTTSPQGSSPQNDGASTLTAGTTIVLDDNVTTVDDVLNFSNGAGQTGLAIVRYDNDGNGLTDGMGGVDLTHGGLLDRFFFEVLTADLEGAVFTTSVTSGTGGGAFTGTEVEIIGATFDPFTRFNAAGFTGVDFEDVTSLAFSFDTRGAAGGGPNGSIPVASFDGSIGSISAVPLPASVLLLIGGLGGLAGVSAVSKRRRKA